MIEQCFAALQPVSWACKIETLFLPLFLAALILLHAALIGSKISRLVQDDAESIFKFVGYGLLADALIVFELAHLGFLTRTVTWIYLLIPLLLPPARLLSRILVGVRLLKDTNLFEKLVGIFLLVRFSLVVLPQSQTDPLYYHVSSAWLWSQAGRAYFVDWLPWSLQGGLAEYLYTWLASLTGERLSLLLSAQALHGAVGMILSPLLVYQIARMFLPRSYAVMALFAAATLPGEAAMLIRAKNDGFVLFFALLSVYSVLQAIRNLTLSRVAIVAAFAGAALGMKHTAAFIVLPIWLALITLVARHHEWSIRRRLQAGLGCLALSLLFCLPILGRNWDYTGNPFFPAMDRFFHSIYLNASINEVVSSFSYAPGSLSEILLANFERFVFSKPWYVLGIIAPIWMNREGRALAKIGWGCFVLLILVTGKGRYERFGFPLFSIFAILGGIAAMNVARVLKSGRVKMPDRLISLFFVAMIVASSGVEVPFKRLSSHLFPFVFSLRSPAQVLAAELPVYEMHVWMNQHVAPGKVLSLYNNENLFLNMPLSAPENEVRANRVRFAATEQQLHQALVAGEFRYIQVPGIAADYCPILSEAARAGTAYKLIHEVNGIKLLEVPAHL